MDEVDRGDRAGGQTEGKGGRQGNREDGQAGNRRQMGKRDDGEP